MNVSQKIQLDGLGNTRDLGGITTAEGKTVKKGRLIRSGQLYHASKRDKELLSSLGIVRIYDFRTADERNEKPDPDLPGIENIYLPILSEAREGISHSEEDDRNTTKYLVENAMKDPDFAVESMSRACTEFVSDPHCVAGYRQFLNDVMDNKTGAILWHCTGGKDRAGFAAILILTILGVSKEDILADYLMTNTYIKDDIANIMDGFAKKLPPELQKDEAVCAKLTEGFRGFCEARLEYFNASFATADKLYGGFDNYIKEALGITEEKIAAFKANYLE